MPEQPQWSERTLDMPPQDPWADQPTSQMAPDAAPTSPAPASSGSASSGTATPKTSVFGAAGSEASSPKTTAFGPASSGTASQSGSVSPTAAASSTGSAPSGTASTGSGGTGSRPAGSGATGSASIGTVAPGAQQPEQPDQSPFSKGRARVTQRTQQFTGQFTSQHEPTGTGWPEEAHREPPRSLSAQIQDLRRGGEWSSAAALFAFVCWGIWALSSDGDLLSAFIIFVVTLLVAVGVFALARLVGRLVLEQRMGRRRHTARGAHVVAGLFLAGVGIAFLRQTEWVMTVVNWVTSSF